MAEIRPIESLRYNLAAVPSLQDVAAPPYDVISPAMRAELLARSAFNVVELDLPEAPGEVWHHIPKPTAAELRRERRCADATPGGMMT